MEAFKLFKNFWHTFILQSFGHIKQLLIDSGVLMLLQGFKAFKRRLLGSQWGSDVGQRLTHLRCGSGLQVDATWLNRSVVLSLLWWDMSWVSSSRAPRSTSFWKFLFFLFGWGFGWWKNFSGATCRPFRKPKALQKLQEKQVQTLPFRACVLFFGTFL